MADVLTAIPAAPAAPVVETPPATPVPPIGAPTPVPAATPSVIPVAAAPAVIEPPVVPVTPELRAYVQRMESENAQAQQQALMSARNEFVAKRAAEYEAEGLPAESAQKFAARDGDTRLQQINAESARQNQINAAFDVAAKFKVDPRSLMNLPSLAAMEQAAINATQEGAKDKRIAELEARLSKVEKTPPAIYASGISAGQAGSGSYIEALKNGKPLPPAAEIDRQTADWLRRQTA